MEDPKVSIITINYNGLEDTIECLNSLKKINYPNYEIFVVDNASENNEGDKLKEKFKDHIRLIKSKENAGLFFDPLDIEDIANNHFLSILYCL